MRPGVIEHLLVIGYGNTLRRDDGAGVALAEAIAARWRAQGQVVRLHTAQQLTPELAIEMADDELTAVVFVDAAMTVPEGGIEIRRLHTETSSPSLGHQLGPAALVAYAGLFRPLLPPMWIVTIGGHDFGIGEGFSPSVARSLAIAQQGASDLLAQIKEDIATCTKSGLPRTC
jgi:hydrogenase maturation protease